MTPGQIVEIPFAGGINEKQGDKYLVPGSEQRRVENGVFTKNNTISKRFGFDPLPTSVIGGGSILGGRKLLAYKGEVDAVDLSATLYSYSQGESSWSSVDQVSPCVATRYSVAQSTATFSSPDIAESNGIRIVAWINGPTSSGGDLYCTVYDSVTGNTIASSIKLDTGTLQNPRIVAMSGYAYVFYGNSADGSLHCAPVNLSNPSQTLSKTTITASTGGFGSFDAVPIIGGTQIVFAFENTNVSNSIAIFLYNASGGVLDLVTSVTNTETHTTVILGIRAQAGEGLWLSYIYSSGGVITGKCALFTLPGLLYIQSPVQVFTLTSSALILAAQVERMDSTHAFVLYTTGAGSFKARVSSSGVVDRGPMQFPYYGLMSRPFKQGDDTNGRIYAMFAVGGTSPTTELMDLNANDTVTATARGPRPVATVARQFSGGQRNFCVCSVVNQGSNTATQFVTVSGIDFTSTNANYSGRVGIIAVTYDFDHPGRWLSAELGDCLYIGGGVPSIYDGKSVVECGFITPPDAANITQSKSTVGGGLANRVYFYAFLWEWIDARGQRHQSAPSFVTVDQTVSATNTNTVTFTVPICGPTMRQEIDTSSLTNVGLVVYRTYWNGTTMSTVYYRVSPDTPDVLNSITGGTQTITYLDDGNGNKNDNGIKSNALLYTTGGVVESDAPPSFSSMCAHKNRIWGVGDDGRTIWYSTEQVNGEPVRFNDAFTFLIQDSGSITAIASMDDKLIVFKRDRIYVVYGDGPPQTGIGGDLTVPQRIASDVGCIDPRSVLLMPMGLMFQSAQGIMLLDRGLSVSWIGKPVVDTLASYPTITSASLIGSQSQAIFTLVSSDRTVGRVLSFDYVQNAWSTWIVNDSGSYGLGAPFVSSVVAGDVLYLMTDKGAILRQKSNVQTAVNYSASYCKDGSNWVQLLVETAWMTQPQKQAYMRVRRGYLLADNVDPHNVTVEFAVDYGSYVQGRVITADLMVSTPLEQIGTHIAFQKCQSIRGLIFDAAPSGGPSAVSGAGPVLNAIAYEIAPMKGIRKNLSPTLKG